jgi:hypothetical protein
MISPKTSRVALAIASVLSLAALVSARAATITLHPVADTTLEEFSPNSNMGGGTTFVAGGRRQGGRDRALMLFDIFDNLPAGATINSASLTLSVVGVPSGGFNSTFDLNRILASWGEGNGSDHGGSPAGPNQATWNNRLGTSGSPWTTPGGDFSPTVSASRAITSFGSYTFGSTANLIADVQSWLTTPGSNFGWLLRSESEARATSIRRFGSRDDAVNSPSLVISYTVVPEPGVCALAGLCVTAWTLRSRRT